VNRYLIFWTPVYIKRLFENIMPGVQILKTDKLTLSIIQNFEKYLVQREEIKILKFEIVHEFASSLKKYLYLGLLLIQGGPTYHFTQRIDFENIFEYTYLHFFICHTVFPSQNTDKMTVNYECVFFYE
jgi:hypothetical protein